MKIKINKGLDLKLKGDLSNFTPETTIVPDTCAMTPDDFPGFIPKPAVKEGEHVAVGAPLLFDKNHPDIKLTAPCAGVVSKIARGERRKILYVEITRDGVDDYKDFDTSRPLISLLAESGLFANFRRRPYDVIPDPDVRPRDIFVTAIDSAPLAMPLQAMLGTDAPQALKTAAEALATLTDGKIYISHNSTWTLGPIPGCEMVEVAGKHPSGNPGVQIAHIAPINKGDNVWTLDIIAMYKIGRLLTTGQFDPEEIVAVTGPEVERPYVVKTIAGAAVAPLLAGRLAKADHHIRVISGNVLTGVAVDPSTGFLHFPYRQITVIAEGDDKAEFMGWASISPDKMSASRSLPLHLLHKSFAPDARILGGHRAMIMSGEYDKVLPMDILAEYLIKAIISRNIDDMEALGIYEVAPEDFALCEYVDTSKLPLQQIVRDGLDYLRKELE